VQDGGREPRAPSCDARAHGREFLGILTGGGNPKRILCCPVRGPCTSRPQNRENPTQAQEPATATYRLPRLRRSAGRGPVASPGSLVRFWYRNCSTEGTFNHAARASEFRARNAVLQLRALSFERRYSHRSPPERLLERTFVVLPHSTWDTFFCFTFQAAVVWARRHWEPKRGVRILQSVGNGVKRLGGCILREKFGYTPTQLRPGLGLVLTPPARALRRARAWSAFARA